MTRREYMPGQVGGGISSFQGVAQPGAPTVRPTDYSGIRSALDAWAVDTFQQREAEVMQRMQDRAAIEQTAMGVSGVVEAPDLARRYQQAFDQRARAVYDQQIKTDAISTANNLVRQHRLDPQGFNASWGEYIQSTTSAIKDSDPALAAGVETYLASVGAQFSNQLEENVFQRELETQAAELVSLYEQQRVAYRDLILNNPDEALVEQAIAETTQILIDADAAAVLSPDAIRRMAAAIRDDYYEEFARGSAAQYFAAEDYKGVEFLINELETGKWFDDNGKARQLANQFRNQLPKPEGMSSGQIRLAANVARDMRASVERGGVLTEADYKRLERAINIVEGYGSETDIDSLNRELNAIHAASSYLPNIAGAPAQQLNALIEFFTSPDAASRFPVGYPDTVLRLVENEIERKRTAFENNDLASLGLPSVSNLSFVDFTMMERGDQEQFFNLLETNREIVSADNQIPLELVPTWNVRQTREAVDMIRARMAAGDAHAAINLVNLYMTPYVRSGWSAAGMNAIGAVDPELAGTIIVAEAFAAVGGRDAAAFFNLSLEGQGIDPTGDSTKVNTAIAVHSDALMMLSGHSLTRYGFVQKAARNMFRAIAARDENPRKEFENILTRMEVVELANGMEIPANLLGDGPEVRRLSMQVINDWFAELRDLNIPIDFESLVPEVAGAGQFTFRDTVRGIPLRDHDGTIVRLSVTPDRLIEAREADIRDRESAEAAYQTFIENPLMLDGRTRTRALRVGEDAGLTEQQTLNAWRAINTTPAVEMTRLPNGIAPEVLDSEYIDVARRTARPDITGRQRPLRNTEAQQLATFVYYADLLKKFNGDERKALAALYAGVSDVQFAIDVDGDAWESAMDKNTRAFIYRALTDD